MSADDGAQQFQNSADGNADNGPEDDDDFGEFEGFEGGVENMQAQPTPSPWATFPDLLPVQTSPATPADEVQAASSRLSTAPREVRQSIAEPGQWIGSSNHEESRNLQQQVRILNPPDVSLGTNEAIYGRSISDSIHVPRQDAAAAAIDQQGGAAAFDSRLSAQIDALHHQLGSSEQSRIHLEEQINILRQRNSQLEQEVAISRAKIDDLESRLQHNQEKLEGKLLELNTVNHVDCRKDLQLVQEEISAIKKLHLGKNSEMEAFKQNLMEVTNEILERVKSLQSDMQKKCTTMEESFSLKIDERCNDVREGFEVVIKQLTEQVSKNLCQLEAVQSSNICEDHQGNSLLQIIKIELEKHKEHQKQALERERHQQLVTLSSAMESALRHLKSTINKSPALEDGEFS